MPLSGEVTVAGDGKLTILAAHFNPALNAQSYFMGPHGKVKNSVILSACVFYKNLMVVQFRYYTHIHTHK